MMTEEQHLANALTAFIGRPLDNPLSRSEIMETARIALAALTQPASPALKLPDGWVAVPLEPTEEMIAAWRDDMDKSYAKEHAIKIGEDEIVFAHQAMLAAAPAVPHTAPIEPICATGGAEWVKVPKQMTPEMIKAVQENTEIGSYIAENWTCAYALFDEFYKAALAAAPEAE